MAYTEIFGDTGYDSQDVIKIARYFETQTKNRAKYKVAVIVSRDLEYGLSKTYQVAAADLPAKIGIFNNLEEAKKWVTGQIKLEKHSLKTSNPDYLKIPFPIDRYNNRNYVCAGSKIIQLYRYF